MNRRTKTMYVIENKFSWNPLSIPTLRLWLSADQPSKLWQDASATTPAVVQADPIGAYQDRSINAYHFTQSATKRPLLQLGDFGINSHPSILFDGSNDILVNATPDWLIGDSVGTIAMVVQVGTWAANKVLFSSSDEAATTRYFKVWIGTDGHIRVSQRNADTEDILVGDTTLGPWQVALVIIRSDNNDFFVRINGVDQTLTGAGGSNTGDWFDSISARDNVAIGGWKTTSETGISLFQLSDLVVCGSNLTGTDLTNLENYLKIKNGLNFSTIKRISVIGDSIPASPGNTYGFPILLTKSYNYGNVYLMNHAVSGQSIMTHMDTQVTAAASDNADIIILQLGVNDNEAGDMVALQAELEENIVELQTSNPRATLYYMGVLPIFSGSGAHDPVPKPNIRGAQRAACLATGITFWDTYTDPWISYTDTVDYTHPNAGGHQKILAQIKARLPQ
jgi:hypothetical protein